MPRGCNKVADALAKFSSSLDQDDPKLWLDHFPDFVHYLVASDLAELLV